VEYLKLFQKFEIEYDEKYLLNGMMNRLRATPPGHVRWSPLLRRNQGYAPDSAPLQDGNHVTSSSTAEGRCCDLLTISTPFRARQARSAGIFVDDQAKF
jgi:hypothetical protein